VAAPVGLSPVPVDGVDRDPRDPGSHLGLTPKLGKACDDGGQDLLQDVLALGVGSEEARQERLERRQLRAEHPVEGGGLPTPAGLDGLEIGLERGLR